MISARFQAGDPRVKEFMRNFNHSWLRGTVLWLFILVLLTSLSCGGDPGAATVKQLILIEVQGEGRYAAQLAVSNDKKLVICSSLRERKLFVYTREPADGRLAEIHRFALPDRGRPVDSAILRKGLFCTLDHPYNRIFLWHLPEHKDKPTPDFSVALNGRLKGDLVQNPIRVVMHPRLDVIYVVAEGSHQVWVLSVAEPNKPQIIQCVGTTGQHEDLALKSGARQFTYLSPYVHPRCLVLSPDGKHLYTAGAGSRCLFHFLVSETDGSLKLGKAYDPDSAPKRQRGQFESSLMSPFGMETSPDGKWLYMGGLADTLGVFERDLETGAVSLRQVLDSRSEGLSCLDNVHLIRCSNNGLYVLVATGAPGALPIFRRGDDGTLKLYTILRNEDFTGIDFSGISDAHFLSGDKELIFTSARHRVAVIDLTQVKP
jgi:6-phosphogluconolactonase (cycloisomerase 2 family)